MPFATLFVTALALGICFVPVLLARRTSRARAQDFFVAPDGTRPEVVRNASIAYALRISVLGPLFALGAAGELWPAMLVSGCFGLGVWLIYVLRRPLLEFLDDALSRDRSITVHEFIARQHGGNPRVRLLAASLTIFALLGLLLLEVVAVATILRPFLPESAWAVSLVVLAALLASALHAVPAGHSGVMHSGQLQLGILYLGLFGPTALFLYLHVSALAPLPPHVTLATVVIAVCCAIMLGYRRSKYVDTAIIHPPDARRASLGARALSRFEKILNPCLSVLAVAIVALALMKLYAAGLPTIARDTAAALQTGTRLPGVGLLALCVLALVYPIVDLANWQKLAAVAKEASASGVAPDRRSATLRSVFGMYAAESAFVLLSVGMLGAVAAIAVEAPDGADRWHRFVAKLGAADNQVTAAAVALLLVCVGAAALSTMSALLSATLCTIRYDLLGALWPEMAPEKVPAAMEPKANRRTLAVGGGIALTLAAAFWAADASLRLSFTSGTFLALLFAFCCAQLSLAPLVLGPIVGRACGVSGSASPGWALVIAGAGASSGIAAAAVYLATGTDAWLWAAIPVCVGSGAVLLAVARGAARFSG